MRPPWGSNHNFIIFSLSRYALPQAVQNRYPPPPGYIWGWLYYMEQFRTLKAISGCVGWDGLDISELDRY